MKHRFAAKKMLHPEKIIHIMRAINEFCKRFLPLLCCGRQWFEIF